MTKKESKKKKQNQNFKGVNRENNKKKMHIQEENNKLSYHMNSDNLEWNPQECKINKNYQLLKMKLINFRIQYNNKKLSKMILFNYNSYNKIKMI